ncbi:MAG: hypothetical protein M3Q00_08450 [Pseudomonadota bacterium]|nr:hypothetical protein [Pseudomonadota bacterium]
MSAIIAGRFQTFDQAERVSDTLVSADFKPDDVSVFYVNPPGQHDATPIGGDHIESDPGATESTNEAATGAATGGAIGLALGMAAVAVPVLGPAVAVAAAGVGAYTGSLAGGLSGAGESDSPAPSPRRAGVFLAVRAPDDQATQRAIGVLGAEGAEDIELADGIWRDGQWVDFDPVNPPRLISAPEGLYDS